MKHQGLFSMKDKSNKKKWQLLQFLLGALRVKTISNFLKLRSSWDLFQTDLK